MGMYDLELAKLIKRIREKKHKMIMIQLPDGLKPEGKHIVDAIRTQTGAECIIWMGSCFGACDIPLGIQNLGVDMYVQWGHNMFRRIEGW